MGRGATDENNRCYGSQDAAEDLRPRRTDFKNFSQDFAMVWGENVARICFWA